MQVTLLLCLLFLYAYYESKRKETAPEPSLTIQNALPEWIIPLANVPQPGNIEGRP